MQMTKLPNAQNDQTAPTIPLCDGEAAAMGDGVFVVFQDSPDGPQSVVMTVEDLRALLAIS